LTKASNCGLFILQFGLGKGSPFKRWEPVEINWYNQREEEMSMPTIPMAMQVGSPSGTSLQIFDAIVAPSGGTHTSLAAALADTNLPAAPNILVRSGVYSTSENLQLKDGTRIIGENYLNTTIDFMGQQYNIYADGSQNAVSKVSIENIKITGSTNLNGSLYFNEVTNGTISNCDITSTKSCIQLDTCTNTLVTNCLLSSSNSGGAALEISSCTFTSIMGCYLALDNTHGINTHECESLKILNNILEGDDVNQGNTAIIIYQGSNVDISHNRITGNEIGLEIDEFSSNPSEKVEISHNIFHSNDDGITVQNSESINISSNQVSSCTNDGITISDCVHCSINGNTIVDAVTGLFISSSICAIRSNIITGNSDDGVKIINCSSVPIVGNYIEGNTGNGLYIEGSPYCSITTNCITNSGQNKYNLNIGDSDCTKAIVADNQFYPVGPGGASTNAGSSLFWSGDISDSNNESV
jgi:parallel beta-helix repeat protein